VPLRALNILLVEKSPGGAPLHLEHLLAGGHSVVLAPTLCEARIACAQSMFDLLLCHLPLPNSNGLELLERARLLRPGAEGIVISDFGDWYRREAARRAGFMAYLMDPLHLELLDRLIWHLRLFSAPQV